jgi:hypothetical protein
MVNEDKPEQVLPSQVVEVNTVHKDHGNMDIAVDNKNMSVVSMNEDKSEQVVEMDINDEDHGHVDVNPTQMLTLSTMRTTGTWMWLTPTPTPT